MTFPAEFPPNPAFPIQRDASGFAVFSQGDAGRAHVAAHRALDSGQLASGYHELAAWLGERPAHTSQLVHLHWHLLVFEIAVGRVAAAQRRLERHLLPAVVFREAATDAPAALWRLRVAGSEPKAASWHKCAAYARAGLRREASPFVRLHHLLALAGAGDHGTLCAWLRARPAEERVGAHHTYALGLEAMARADLGRAADLLGRAAPMLARSCGGSQAQSALFCLVAQYAWQKSRELPPPSVAA